MVMWLPDDGAFAASLQGGPQFLGYGRDRAIRMDSFDLAGAIAVGKKAPTLPRPGQRTNRGR